MRSRRLPLPLLFVLATASVWPAAVRAQIYGNAGAEDAPLVLSNHPSDETPVLVLAAPPVPVAPAPAASAPAPTSAASAPVAVPPAAPTRAPALHLSSLITRIAKEHAVADTLVRAVVAAESGFDVRAVSRKGAKGLMQLMPDTARRFGVRDVFSDEQNLRGGTAYLRWLLDYFSGDVALALAGYNAGEGAVMRAGRRVPDIAETRDYVPKVLAYQAHYARTSR